jgi:hypothetical protein
LTITRVIIAAVNNGVSTDRVDKKKVHYFSNNITEQLFIFNQYTRHKNETNC